jgi:protease I
MCARFAVVILIEDAFRDEEVLIPRDVLSAAGGRVVLAASRQGECRGMLGATVTPDMTLPDVCVEDFDAILIPGGEGTPVLRSHPIVQELVQAFARESKLVCALCWAPTILAVAGLLEGRRAVSCHIDETSDFPNMKSHQVLLSHGAILADAHVVRDGNIITGDGPQYAHEFAQTVLEALMGLNTGRWSSQQSPAGDRRKAPPDE